MDDDSDSSDEDSDEDDDDSDSDEDDQVEDEGDEDDAGARLARGLLHSRDGEETTDDDDDDRWKFAHMNSVDYRHRESEDEEDEEDKEDEEDEEDEVDEEKEEEEDEVVVEVPEQVHIEVEIPEGTSPGRPVKLPSHARASLPSLAA